MFALDPLRSCLACLNAFRFMLCNLPIPMLLTKSASAVRVENAFLRGKKTNTKTDVTLQLNALKWFSLCFLANFFSPLLCLLMSFVHFPLKDPITEIQSTRPACQRIISAAPQRVITLSEPRPLKRHLPHCAFKLLSISLYTFVTHGARGAGMIAKVNIIPSASQWGCDTAWISTVSGGEQRVMIKGQAD